MQEKRVMVIDDEPDIQAYLAAALEDEGYRVCVPAVGQSIDVAVREEKPDLILLDIILPGSSGIAVYRRLRGDAAVAQIPIVLMSGMASVKDFLPQGFRDLAQDDSLPLPAAFLEKPIRLDVLCDTLGSLLGGIGS